MGTSLVPTWDGCFADDAGGVARGGVRTGCVAVDAAGGGRW